MKIFNKSFIIYIRNFSVAKIDRFSATECQAIMIVQSILFTGSFLKCMSITSQQAKKATNFNVNGNHKLWWSQVDSIRTLFINPNDEIIATIRLAESIK